MPQEPNCSCCSRDQGYLGDDGPRIEIAYSEATEISCGAYIYQLKMRPPEGAAQELADACLQFTKLEVTETKTSHDESHAFSSFRSQDGLTSGSSHTDITTEETASYSSKGSSELDNLKRCRFNLTQASETRHRSYTVDTGSTDVDTRPAPYGHNISRSSHYNSTQDWSASLAANGDVTGTYQWSETSTSTTDPDVNRSGSDPYRTYAAKPTAGLNYSGNGIYELTVHSPPTHPATSTAPANYAVYTYTYSLKLSVPFVHGDPELPEFGDWWVGYLASSPPVYRRLVGPCSTDISLSKLKWRIVILSPPVTCYIKVWIAIAFTPLNGTESVTVESQEFQFTGSPCIKPPVDGSSDNPNLLLGSINTAMPPIDPGEKYVRIQKWSYLPDYEPDISDPNNPQRNGYPYPGWSPSAP